MIRIEEYIGVPPVQVEDLAAHSAAEFTAAGDLSYLSDTQGVAFFDNEKFLVSFNLRKPAGFLAPTEVYLLLGHAYRPRYLRLTRSILHQWVLPRHRGLVAMINVASRPACRFAEFLGFRPRGEVIFYADRQFRLYEVYS